jgi:uncharacterized protein (TIGR03435 family)
MTATVLRIWPLLVLCCGAIAQTAPAKPEFDAASIKASPPPEQGRGIRVGCDGGPGTKDPGLFTCINTNALNLVTRAYSIENYRVAGLGYTRDMFDITARVPEGTTKEEFAMMLQNLLADRFHLAVHHEIREIEKYDLVVAKNGPKFKNGVEPAPEKPDATPVPFRMTADKEGYPAMAPGRPGMAMMNGKARMYQPKMTMEKLAQQVGFQVGKPVTDATGLAGEFEIGLYWASDTQLSAKPDATDPADSGPTLPQALQDQLGLRLEQKKGPVDFLVVDHIDKMPTAN